MTSNNEFFDALRKIRLQARRIATPEEEILLAFRQATETFLLVDADPEREQRGLTYLVVPLDSTLNGDFETDLASWTEALDAGITATTTQISNEASKTLFGSLGSLKISITGSTGAGQQARRQQSIASVAGNIWSLEVWGFAKALASAKVRFILEFLDSLNAVLATAPIQEITVVGTIFQQLKIENQTAPASTANVRIKLVGESTASGGSGTIYFDLVRAEKGQTVISARDRRILAGEFKAS